LPIVYGYKKGLDVKFDQDTLLLLQPTRVIKRKRIPRNLELQKQLFSDKSFCQEIRKQNKEIVLHITGPTPAEHKADVDAVVKAYHDMLQKIPEDLREQVFLSFGVAKMGNESFMKKKFSDIGLEEMDIHHVFGAATMLVFPSETEGRGLPIIEAAACGMPIICSRYEPQTVFSETVGEHLPEERQIRFIEWPEGKYPKDFIQKVRSRLIDPKTFNENKEHNRLAVEGRYSYESLYNNIEEILKKF